MPNQCGEKIKEFRKFLKKNQKAFGDLFGVHQSTVVGWETNDDLIIQVRTAREIIRLAKETGFDLTLEHIYGDNDDH